MLPIAILLDSVSITIIFILLLSVFRVKIYQNRSMKTFEIIFALLLFLILDLLYNIFLNKTDTISITLLFIIKTLFFITMSVMIFLWSNLNLFIIFDDQYNSTHQYRISYALLAINIFLCFSNTVIPVLFRIGSNGNFEAVNIGMYIYTIVNYLICALSSINAILYRKELKKGTIYTILLFVIPPLIAEVISIFNRALPLNFAYTLSGIFLYFSYQTNSSLKDELTGIGNRHLLDYKIKTWINSSKKITINTLLINIQNLKNINTIFGHDIGDKVIRKVENILSHFYSKNVYPIRYSGDEYVLIYISNNYNKNINNLENDFINYSKDKLYLEDIKEDIKIAIASYSIENKLLTDKDDYLRVIDKKMYEAKNKIANMIDKAILNDEFIIYYQPIYNFKENKFTSSEALLRYRDENGNFVSPEIIISEAEKSNYIDEIGRVVLDKVCRFINYYKEEGYPFSCIDINISFKECLKRDFVYRTVSIVDSYHLPHEMFNFELTETITDVDEKTIWANLKSLYEQGFSISIDDFGKGYSNFNRITQLPFSCIKLDKIIADNYEDPNTEILIKNIIRLTHDLNMKALIEGVETEEQLKFFKEIDCDFVQGYYFSRPLPMDKYIEFLQNNNK